MCQSTKLTLTLLALVWFLGGLNTEAVLRLQSKSDLHPIQTAVTILIWPFFTAYYLITNKLRGD